MNSESDDCGVSRGTMNGNRLRLLTDHSYEYLSFSIATVGKACQEWLDRREVKTFSHREWLAKRIRQDVTLEQEKKKMNKR
jgi:hypothetical protein